MSIEISSTGALIDHKKQWLEQRKKEQAEKRQAQKEAREEKKKLAAIEAEKAQKEVESITINIEWKKSRMWGSNPHCEAIVRFKDGSSERSATYTASGCGYDKESTVIADVFNAYLLYKLHRIGTTKEHPYGVYLREDWKNYNGGVGTSCYYRIAEFIGGKFRSVGSGKTFNVYEYTDNA